MWSRTTATAASAPSADGSWRSSAASQARASPASARPRRTSTCAIASEQPSSAASAATAPNGAGGISKRASMVRPWMVGGNPDGTPTRRIADGMKLGINMGYWSSAGPPPDAAELIREADRLRPDSVWTAEAYGSDVLTPLAWWGAGTERIRLGTAIAQLSAREPAATAMAAITMDHLSQGRFILGLGVSGPQVVEGWYGKPFAKPLQRTREYIEIVRAILRRDGPVTYSGEQHALPLPGSELGKPLKASVRPLREDLPIFLAAEGPKNIALAAELCEGWLALFYAPSHEDFYRDALDEGFARPGARRGGGPPPPAPAAPARTSRSSPACRSSSPTTSRRCSTRCARCTPSTS